MVLCAASALFKQSGWTVVSTRDLRNGRVQQELYKQPRCVSNVVLSGMVRCSSCSSSLGTLMQDPDDPDHMDSMLIDRMDDHCPK